MPNIKFLLHNPNCPTFQGWGNIPIIQEGDISSILDQSVTAGSAKIATSIPTPLARVFSFKTAFVYLYKELCAGKSEEELTQTMFGGLVSDCLDLLEFIFKNGTERFTVRNITLTHDNDIGRISNRQDSQSLMALSRAFNSTILSNFGNGANNGSLTITLFLYGEGDDDNNKLVVGGTSPFTYVFTSPNLRNFMRNYHLEGERGLSEDRFWDNEFTLLGARNPKFIKYLYDLVSPVLSSNNTSNPLYDFAKYVEKSIMIRYTENFTTTLNNEGQYNAQEINVAYSPRPNNSFTFKKIILTEKEDLGSDFFIAHRPHGVDRTPLVLSRNSPATGAYFRGESWNANVLESIGILHENINERTLPGFPQKKYPYITDADLFYPQLLDVSYDINNDFFHTINVSDDVRDQRQQQLRYLLPVKPLFFDILLGGLSDDNITTKIRYEVDDKKQKVVVKLIVPITGTSSHPNRNIEFTKTYSINDAIRVPFELAFFPFFRNYTDNNSAINLHKKFIMWVDKLNEENRISKIKLYNKDCRKIDDITLTSRMTYGDNDNTDYKYETKYITTDADFRILEFETNGGAKGILIPKFINVPQQLTKVYKYAIDFGTTNTHVAYVEMDQNWQIIEGQGIGPRPFKIDIAGVTPLGTEKPLVVLLHKNHDQLGEMDKVYEVLLREFIPTSIGNKSSDQLKYGIQFPMRSVMMDFQKPNVNSLPFVHSNIAFKIGEMDNFHDKAIYTTDLKWAFQNNMAGFDNTVFGFRVRLFFEQLLYMIKYKAILDGCNPENLFLCFTRPTSMVAQLEGQIQNQIRTAIFNVFNFNVDNNNHRFIFGLSESEAPYEYIKNDFGGKRYCNIDIGGGTTDILLRFEDPREGNPQNKSSFILSFKFAGNDIWGNDINRKEHNGVIDYFIRFANHRISSLADTDEFVIAYKDFKKYFDKGEPDKELVSVLFKNDIRLGFTENVFNQRPAFKLLFLFHIASIVYYINKIILQNQEGKLAHFADNPFTITLSGNGSRYLNLINLDASEMKFIFDIFFALYNPELQITFVERQEIIENPKEATANGALRMQNNNNNPNVANANVNGGQRIAIIRQNPQQVNNGATPNVQYKHYKFENSSDPREELISSIQSLFEPLIAQLEINDALKDIFGDITPHKNMLTNEKIRNAVNIWWNNNIIDLNNPNNTVFFEPIKILLFNLSREIAK